MAPVNNQTGIKEKCSRDICCIARPGFNVPELKAENKERFAAVGHSKDVLSHFCVSLRLQHPF